MKKTSQKSKKTDGAYFAIYISKTGSEKKTCKPKEKWVKIMSRQFIEGV